MMPKMTDAERVMLDRIDATISAEINGRCIPHMLRNDILHIIGWDTADLALLHKVPCRKCGGDGGPKNGYCKPCCGTGVMPSHHIVPV